MGWGRCVSFYFYTWRIVITSPETMPKSSRTVTDKPPVTTIVTSAGYCTYMIAGALLLINIQASLNLNIKIPEVMHALFS